MPDTEIIIIKYSIKQNKTKETGDTHTKSRTLARCGISPVILNYLEFETSQDHAESKKVTQNPVSNKISET